MSYDAKEFLKAAALMLGLFLIMWICFAAFPDGFYR